MKQKKKSSGNYYPSIQIYHHGLTTEDWLRLLEFEKIFGLSVKIVMHMFMEQKGKSTCENLAKTYGKTSKYYFNLCINTGKKVYEETDCALYEGTKEETYWPILFQGSYVLEDGDKRLCLHLREELKRALEEIHLPDIQQEKDKEQKYYWWLNANPKYWKFSEINIGDKVEWTLYNENGNKRRIFKNFLDAKEGNFVIGYESTPVKKIVALGKVCKQSDGESLYIEKVEDFHQPIEFDEFKDIEELKNMEYLINSQGSLFKLSQHEYEILMQLVRNKNPLPKDIIPIYTKEMFLEEVYVYPEEFDTLKSLLTRKKNIILQGAPGVGKTFIAKRLAYALIEKKDNNRVQMIQFHQSYSYEEFIMGYRPDEEGFKLEYGVFYQFCKRAKERKDEPHFFIIDEINRGNLSKIFGELLMLIENDKRGEHMVMPYDQKSFYVPENIYIIGLMNTADRSLAMIDYALRRRFSFYTISPAFDKPAFQKYQDEIANEKYRQIISLVQKLNIEIKQDTALGEGFVIGHSYFCGQNHCSDPWLKEVVNYDIIPILEEYWYDDTQKISAWKEKFYGVLNE